FRLKEGVLWSDGEPLTADDVAFTIEWALDEANSVTSFSFYETIDSTEVIDDLTIKINFGEPNPTWADAYTGMGAGLVLPKHILEGADQSVTDEFRSNPIGTGPFKVESFSANDQVTYVM